MPDPNKPPEDNNTLPEQLGQSAVESVVSLYGDPLSELGREIVDRQTVDPNNIELPDQETLPKGRIMGVPMRPLIPSHD